MIHLVVSQPAEARPLVEHLGLAARPGGAFPIYRRDDMALVVSGSGKLAAAAATAHLHLAVGGGRDGGWLNVGVAGHAELQIGRGLLAHKVLDAGSGAAWYPPPLLGEAGARGVDLREGRLEEGAGVAAGGVPTAGLVTVDRIEGEYDGGDLYDTEASGFFTAAGRVASVELVHTFKVVADNHAATLGDNFGAAVVDDLVRSKVELLAELLAQLGEMSATARRGRERQRWARKAG